MHFPQMDGTVVDFEGALVAEAFPTLRALHTLLIRFGTGRFTSSFGIRFIFTLTLFLMACRFGQEFNAELYGI